jgi:predicted RecB family nuclease
MYKENGQLVFSPSDLVRFMESPYSCWMERYHLEFPGILQPDEPTPEQELVMETGNRHERNYLTELQAQGTVTVIERDRNAEAATAQAIQNGAAVIFQACLRHGPFRGYADFLKRIDRDAEGRHQYEIWDTKLARSAKPTYLIQLCCYAEMLEPLQGRRPKRIGVVLGSGDSPVFNTEEFFHTYLQLRSGLLALMDAFDPNSPPQPEPRADHGRWKSHAQHWVMENDHLAQVAGISTSQIRRLEAAKITTVSGLAKTKLTKLPKLAEPIFQRLIEQAQLQIETRERRAKAGPKDQVPPCYRVVQPVPGGPRPGLSMLPPASEGDVFLDLEGFPLTKNGLEYLWGASTRQGGRGKSFHDWWAHDEASEKKALEGFVDWAFARWKQDPAMHIYHYAAYEVSAIKRLMGRHGTREAEVDELLRHEVFIDLYQIVKHGLLVGEPSYSIKSIELLYRGKRSGDVANAGQSIVYYANWLESGEPTDWRASSILKKIRDYNQDDCESTVQLCDWLHERKAEHRIAYLPPRQKVETVEDDEEAADTRSAQRIARRNECRRLSEALENRISKTKDEEGRRLDRLLLHLLEFHRREAKPGWWRLFARLESTVEELMEDLDCIGGATLVAKATQQVKRSKLLTYRFDPNQDTKIRPGQRVYAVPCANATFQVISIDEAGTVQVQISDAKLDEEFPDGPPAETSFAPQEHVSAVPIIDALLAVVGRWVDQQTLPAALLRLLKRQPPRLPKSQPLRIPGEAIAEAAVRVVSTMKESTLCLQGPPGTGKTTSASAMIVELVRQGKNVGVLSNSHKAIENLLAAICSVSGTTIPVFKVGADPEFLSRCPQVTAIANNALAEDKFTGGVIGGTAWLFARPEWVDQLDYLFVDEAEQVSLANLTAVSRCTSNLVLMGDQMQLEQPIQGSHPGESGQSALNYYLQGHATIPDTLGLFLPFTYRLEPETCRFVSDLIYEGRLQPAPGSEKRRLRPKSGTLPYLNKTAGLVLVPVEHEGNVQASDEEAEVVAKVVADLIGRTRINDQGRAAGKLSADDILIVAPYNLQVRRLNERLPNLRVGSVDKFQGQEADVVIVSLCSSFGDYGSRGLEFILDPNRLNVALTRARVMAVVVGDPRIATSPTTNIPALRRLNLFCRLLCEHALSAQPKP